MTEQEVEAFFAEKRKQLEGRRRGARQSKQKYKEDSVNCLDEDSACHFVDESVENFFLPCSDVARPFYRPKGVPSEFSQVNDIMDAFCNTLNITRHKKCFRINRFWVTAKGGRNIKIAVNVMQDEGSSVTCMTPQAAMKLELVGFKYFFGFQTVHGKKSRGTEQVTSAVGTIQLWNEYRKEPMELEVRVMNTPDVYPPTDRELRILEEKFPLLKQHNFRELPQEPIHILIGNDNPGFSRGSRDFNYGIPPADMPDDHPRVIVDQWGVTMTYAQKTLQFLQSAEAFKASEDIPLLFPDMNPNKKMGKIAPLSQEDERRITEIKKEDKLDSNTLEMPLAVANADLATLDVLTEENKFPVLAATTQDMAETAAGMAHNISDGEDRYLDPAPVTGGAIDASSPATGGANDESAHQSTGGADDGDARRPTGGADSSAGTTDDEEHIAMADEAYVGNSADEDSPMEVDSPPVVSNEDLHQMLERQWTSDQMNIPRRRTLAEANCMRILDKSYHKWDDGSICISLP
ncbi:MAG: hypothetical protein ACPHEP_13315, partial [Acidimicrobiales bacterium]